MKRWMSLLGLAAVIVTLVQAGGNATAQATRTDLLYPGCNNSVLTHAAGTEIRTVAQGISGTVASIFRFDNALGRFVGWSPDVPSFAVDYVFVAQRLEPVFICMRTAGHIVQPTGPETLTPMPTPSPVRPNLPAPPTPTPAGPRPCESNDPRICVPPPRLLGVT